MNRSKGPCWSAMVAIVCMLLILALILSMCGKAPAPVPPEVCTDGSVIVREAPDDVAADAEPEPTPDATESPAVSLGSESVTPVDADELDLLSRLICGEMGMSWAPDEQQLYVGSVALNRVASDRFPDTLEEVVYQPGQYACASYLDTLTPDERTIANARQLLEGGSVLPAGVVFQSEAPQGSGVYATYHDEVLGSTTYYCTLEG